MQDDGLPVRHFVNRRANSFFSDAGIFQATVGHEICPPERCPVDVNDAGVDLPCGPYRRVEIVGEYAGTEAVSGRIGELNSVVKVGRCGDGYGGPKEFILRKGVVAWDVSHNRGAHHRSVSLPTGHQFSAI